MSNSGYIAQIPLKYFREMSLDIFPGKLLRGRIILAEDGKVKIELGGAQLTAQTSRAFVKGDIVTLRVTSITNSGVRFEIVDKAPTGHPQTQNPVQVQTGESEVATRIKEQILELVKNPLSQNRQANETSLTNTLKDVLSAQDKYSFFFMAFPFDTGDGKHRHFELLVREFENRDDESEKIHEMLFSTSTPRLGDIAGKILTSGKRMKLDLTSTSKSASEELDQIREPLKSALTDLGFSVTSVNVIHAKALSPIESQMQTI